MYLASSLEWVEPGDEVTGGVRHTCYVIVIAWEGVLYTK